MEFAEEAKRTRIGERKTAIMVTLDVQNAFNSASWKAIDETLRRGAHG